MKTPKSKIDGACKHGLVYCPACLGARNPAAVAANLRRAGPMTDKRKKRKKQKERKELELED